jgi:hypothetical protein
LKENRNGQTSRLNLKKSYRENNWALRKQNLSRPLDLRAAVLSWQTDTAFGPSAVNDSSTLFGRHSF